MHFFHFFIIICEKSVEAVTVATGMLPKELGINYLVLCDNTETQKVKSKIHDYACQSWVGGYTGYRKYTAS